MAGTRPAMTIVDVTTAVSRFRGALRGRWLGVAHPAIVMAGLAPAIHVFLYLESTRAALSVGHAKA